MDKLVNTKTKLLEIALTYSSEDEFKTKNLPKYLLAKKHRVISIAFPPKSKPDKPIKGIYKLYKGLKVVYIGHSTQNLKKSIEELSEGIINYDSYTYYELYSDSDIITLSLYLSNYYRPIHNQNLGKQKLSYTIPDISKILGKGIKGD